MKRLGIPGRSVTVPTREWSKAVRGARLGRQAGIGQQVDGDGFCGREVAFLVGGKRERLDCLDPERFP